MTKTKSRQRSSTDTSLIDYLCEIATDSKSLSEFQRDPKAGERARRLKKGTIDFLWSGDKGEVYRALRDQLQQWAKSPAQRAVAAKRTTALRRARTKAGATQGADNLVVIGTGICTVGQLTLEAVATMRRADKMLYLVSDPIAECVIREFHGPAAESLEGFYKEDGPRMETYLNMVEEIMKHVRRGGMVCVAFYGHPGVFAFSTHESIRRARAEGYRARMLPAISAGDCLIADLGIDPSTQGCQTYEATDFLIHNRAIDPTADLILWQIGVLGHFTFKRHGYTPHGMPLLLSKMAAFYPPSHPVVVYEAPIFPGQRAVAMRVPLAALGQVRLTNASTLYVPASQGTRSDHYAIRSLGLA